MLTASSRDWDKNYDPTVHELTAVIPCLVFSEFIDQLRDELDRGDGADFPGWKTKMGLLKDAVDNDIVSAERCVGYITNNFPEARLIPTAYGIVIEGLDDDAVLSCANHPNLMFEILVTDIEPGC